MVMDKTVVLTGGYGGIGFEAARAIISARQGWHVVIAGRNAAAAADAVQKLNAEAGETVSSAMELDLGSLTSVRAQTASFQKALKSSKLPSLFGLICNAGTQTLKRMPEFTADGYEKTFATNHLGHFLLIHLLLPELQKGSRVILTSSGTHDPDTQAGKPNKSAPAIVKALASPPSDAKDLSGMQRYATSKLCNLMTALEMGRRFDTSVLTANAYDPGPVPTTGLVRTYPAFLRWLLTTPVLGWIGVKTETAEDAGKGLARLLLSSQLAGVTSQYFDPRARATPSKYAQDREAAKRLWDDSVAFLGLQS
jgi:NAD(P)-dependent dehydrogenase (short-subunit alcohol dehydrogenase family)